VDNSIYNDSAPQAAECMRMALSLLGKHQIPVSPLNYRLGYDFVSGRDEKLKQNIANLIAKNQSPSNEELYAIYRDAYIYGYDLVDELRLELTSILSSVQADFEQSGINLGNYADKLTRFMGILDKNTTSDIISTEVEQVISDTRETEVAHRNMQTQLNVLSDEMNTLKRELHKVRKESLTDALTGVSNRNAFDKALDTAITKADEEQGRFAFMLLDLDHFKKVNDTHGHLVGDKVLRYVGATIKKCIKGDDIVARYGGEEFAVILHNADKQGCMAVAEQIRATVAAGVLRDKNSKKGYGQVTISIGIAEYSPNNNADELVNNADQALYRAKDNGRNRVELAA